VTSPNIPPEIDEFLAAHIDSVEQLEVLLLLHHAPDQSWTADAVAKVLYSQPASVARRLASLAQHQLLDEKPGSPPAYRYAPTPASRDALVRLLAEVYRERRVAVISAIASRPMDNVRAFSDAFLFRKNPKE
jgi:DNA-binding MarR family transcriptional regulator